jgi:tetratricopeptide (TPR) repeat protein
MYIFCKKCGEKNVSTQKFCTNCSKELAPILQTNTPGSDSPHVNKKEVGTPNAKKIIRVIIIGAIISWSIYSSLDEKSIDQNNAALSSFNSGDSTQAIEQLKGAVDSAVTNDTKATTLANLGYAYLSDDQIENALSSFKQSLELIKIDTFDFFLISGEIASIEGDRDLAEINYTKAYNIDPNNYQINTALNVFYLELDDATVADYQKALVYAKKAYDLSTGSAKNLAAQNLGITYFFNKNFDETIRLLTPYSDTIPEINAYLGLAYLNKEDTVNAKLYFQKAREGGVELQQEIIDFLSS